MYFSKWATRGVQKCKLAPEAHFRVLGSESGPSGTFEDQEGPPRAGTCVACVCGVVSVRGECHGVSNAC